MYINLSRAYPHNVPKNIHDISKARLSYSVVATNLTDMMPKSMVNSCIGFAETSKLTGETVRVLTYGQLATSGLTVAADYYLSDSSAGGITTTPPTGSGKYLVRVGRASSTSQLIVKIEAPMGRS